MGLWDAWFSFSWPIITLGLADNVVEDEGQVLEIQAEEEPQVLEVDEAAEAMPVQVHLQDERQRPQQESMDDDEIRIEHYGSGLRDCRIGK